MAKFAESVTLVLLHEGQTYVDDPRDMGGASRFGISLRFYKTMHPDATEEDIKRLSMDDAEKIYERKFWVPMRLEEITSQKLANRLLDLGVNAGARQTSLLLQRAINQVKSGLVTVDGITGIKTITTANSLPEKPLYDALINEATIFYKRLSKIGQNSAFLTGWLNRLNDTP